MKKPQILVVDDSEDILVLLKLKLKKLGFDPLEAQDGEDALELIEENPKIEIIIMDIMMPNLTGLEVLEKIRTMKRKDKIKVIFLTADHSDETYDRAKRLGADDYIVKPVRSGILEEKINGLLYPVK